MQSGLYKKRKRALMDTEPSTWEKPVKGYDSAQHE